MTLLSVIALTACNGSVSGVDPRGSRFGDGMHDWVAANRAMAAALAAKGYHHRFSFAENAVHVDGGVIAETLPETLEWLRRSYPIP